MPTMASNFIPEDVHIELHAENGMMGIGAYPREGQGAPNYGQGIGEQPPAQEQPGTEPPKPEDQG